MLAAGAASTGALLLPTAARAAPQPAVPQGDDVAFLAFGAAAAGVLARVYGDARQLRGAFGRRERALLSAAHDRQRDTVVRLNAALGPDDAVPLDGFTRLVALRSRADALAVARRLEAAVVGVFLNGVAYATDPGTRLLLGRLLAVAHGHAALLTAMAGERPSGLPAPVDLEAAGALLDTYLEDPTS